MKKEYLMSMDDVERTTFWELVDEYCKIKSSPNDRNLVKFVDGLVCLAYQDGREDMENEFELERR